MTKLIGWNKLPIGLAELTKQNGSKEVNNNKDVRVLPVRGRKITITTTTAIPAGGKLSTASIKVTLLEDE